MNKDNMHSVNLEALHTVMDGFCALVMADPQFATELYERLDLDKDKIATFVKYAINRVVEESTTLTSDLVNEARQFIVDELLKRDEELTSWGYEVSTAVEYYGQTLPECFHDNLDTLVVVCGAKEAAERYGYLATKTALVDLDQELYGLALESLYE